MLSTAKVLVSVSAGVHNKDKPRQPQQQWGAGAKSEVKAVADTCYIC